MHMWDMNIWFTIQAREDKLGIYLSLSEKFYKKYTDLFEIKLNNMRDENNNDLGWLYDKTNIRLFLKVKSLKWAGHIWCAYEMFLSDQRKDIVRMASTDDEGYFKYRRFNTNG